MDGRSDSFDIGLELDFRGTSEGDILSVLDKKIKDTKRGEYVLAYVNQYNHISTIAQRLSILGAYVENVLKKNEHDFIIIIKNVAKNTENA